MASENQRVSAHRREIARRGEDLAADFLRARNFQIRERNWLCRAGEIDIIAERDGVAHFVEVKTRTSTRFGSPAEAITRSKLRRFHNAIQFYLLKHDRERAAYRADAISILLLKNGEVNIEYIEDVFA